jgi:filamentous hemagglutinin family protein
MQMARFTERFIWTLLLCRLATLPAVSFAASLLPTFTTCVSEGTATCVSDQPLDGLDTRLTITQTTPTLIGSWESFVVDAGASVHFEQPDGATALIRVPSGVTEIDGAVTATGTLYLISPDGIEFDGATIDGHLVASTLEIADADYLAGKVANSDFTGSTGDIHIGANGLSGSTSGLIRLLAANLSAIGAVEVAEFWLSRGAWSQHATALPTFQAGNFRLDTDVASFLRVIDGDGTITTPYQIADLYGLQGIGSQGLNNQHYRLVADIEASTTAQWSRPSLLAGLTDQGFQPIAQFSGSLDGADHSINGLLLRNSANGTGLIAQADNAIVANLTLTDVDIIGAGLRVGAVMGQSDQSIIFGCSSTGRVMGAGQVGGLIGDSQGGAVANSTSSAKVQGHLATGGLIGHASGAFAISQSHASGAVTGDQALGGLIGVIGQGGATIEKSFATGAVSMYNDANGRYLGGLLGGGNDSTVLNDTYAAGSVSGSVAVGGLVGDGAVSLVNSYAIGAVTASAGALAGSPLDIGGLLGADATAAATATASFWDLDTTGQEVSVVGVGQTSAQMKTPATFSGWDFATTWSFCGNDGYPHFLWLPVPNSPTNVNAVAGNAQATVSWTAPTDCGSPITGYRVTGQPSGSCQSSGATSCTVTGLSNGISYTFNVVATNAYGDSLAATASIAVTPNQVPIIDLNGNAAGIDDTVALTDSVALAPAATASDSDNDAGDWNGGALTVQRIDASANPDGSPFDVFSFLSGVNATGGPITQGSDSSGTLTDSGTQYATWSYTSASGLLSIAFDEDASSSLVQDVVRNIGYSNTTPFGNAMLRFTLNDGADSTTADVTVTSNTIYVTRTDDDSDGDAADGFSLREAFARGVAQGGADTIRFAVNPVQAP